MDGYSINGLPLHILIVHVVVIVVPIAALVVLVAAVWPRARRWLGLVTPILGIVAALVVPLATQAGAWLEDRLRSAPLIEKHAALGDTLWPWTLALAILSVVVYVWYRVVDKRPTDAPPSRSVQLRVAGAGPCRRRGRRRRGADRHHADRAHRRVGLARRVGGLVQRHPRRPVIVSQRRFAKTTGSPR